MGRWWHACMCQLLARAALSAGRNTSRLVSAAAGSKQATGSRRSSNAATLPHWLPRIQRLVLASTWRGGCVSYVVLSWCSGRAQ